MTSFLAAKGSPVLQDPASEKLLKYQMGESPSQPILGIRYDLVVGVKLFAGLGDIGLDIFYFLLGPFQAQVCIV